MSFLFFDLNYLSNNNKQIKILEMMPKANYEDDL